MEKKQTRRSLAFRLVDAFFLAGVVLPLLGAVVLKVLYTPASEGFEVSGALIFAKIELPFATFLLTESQINSWAVVLSILSLCLFLTHGLSVRGTLKRQLVAEWIVEKCSSLVNENMGEMFSGFSCFVAAVMALSAFSSLLSLLGLYPPTSDLNVVAGWAILVFALITYYKLKGGLFYYLKGFTEPILAFTPINIISELATPLAMSFRHFGNVLSGTVISALIAMGLQKLSSALLGWLPGALSGIPFLQIGLPAVFSIYFDVFSGCLQAFIFAMLTMLYIKNGFPQEQWESRQAKKAGRKKISLQKAEAEETL